MRIVTLRFKKEEAAMLAEPILSIESDAIKPSLEIGAFEALWANGVSSFLVYQSLALVIPQMKVLEEQSGWSKH